MRNCVPELERQIKVIKEQMRTHHANLLFPSFTQQTTIEFEKYVVMLLNDSLPKRSPSTTYSRRKAVRGKVLDWKKISKLHFGTYEKVHEEISATNNLEESTQGAVCLGPTGNLLILIAA